MSCQRGRSSRWAPTRRPHRSAVSGPRARTHRSPPSTVPQQELIDLSEEHAELDWSVNEPRGARAHPLTDVLVIDGDHNYWTVSQELSWSPPGPMAPSCPCSCSTTCAEPTLAATTTMTRDHPGRVQTALVRGAGLSRGRGRSARASAVPLACGSRRRSPQRRADRGGGLRRRSRRSAACDRARVLRSRCRLARGRPRADALAETLEPWDRNPVVERLESNRVAHLATSMFQMSELGKERARIQRQRMLLQRLLD